MPTVVIWVAIGRLKFGNSACGSFDIHREREVHANERQINVLQCTHFWNVFGIARDVNPEPIHSEYIAVVTTPWMEFATAYS